MRLSVAVLALAACVVYASAAPTFPWSQLEATPRAELDASVIDAPIVPTQYGPVQGFATAQYKAWLGVPFAATTGGANRFMPPKPAESWTAPFNATWWGPGCYQTHHNADVPKVLSENCLNLNVFIANNGSSASVDTPLPVMVFFYGGSFVEGSDQGPFFMYDGDYIASNQPVVVVTANYRLGGLGWVVTNDLKGNMGFQDQIFALQWVKKNIASFGGNPDDITLWGESAGAMSGGLHLVSPASNGLFNKLIMESNPSGMRYRDLSEASLYGMDMCKILGCTVSSGASCNTTCMQQAPVATAADAWNKATNDWVAIVFGNWEHWLDAFLSTLPVIDGDLIPENPMVALPKGNFNKGIPVLFGTNNNEGSTFIYAAFEKPMPSFFFKFLTWGIFGEDNTNKIMDYYKNITSINDMADGRTWFSRVITDYWFRCGSEVFAKAVTEAGSDAFVYRFDHVYNDSTLFSKFGLPAICSTRTCHATELPMVFHFTHLTSSVANFTMTPTELSLSQSFVDYWTSFAIHGNPNTAANNQPQWPEFATATRDNIVLQDKITTENALELCTFWDSIGYDY